MTDLVYMLGDIPLGNVNLYWSTPTRTDRLPPEQWEATDLGAGQMLFRALVSLPDDARLVVQVLPGPRTQKPVKPSAVEQIKSYAVDKRWRVETGGMVWSGVPVPTDDRAKLLILGAAQTLANDATSPLVIGGASYGALTGAQFQALNAAVVAHVQATFAKLAAVLADIDAGTITTTAEIDAAFAAI